MKQQLILIGSGMVGARFIERLLGQESHPYDIHVFNKEPYGGYNRIMLSPVLSGEKSLPEIMTHDEQWYAEHGIHLHTDTPIVNVDTQQQQVVTAQGDTFCYDKLVIATGSNPFVLPIEGSDLPGVVTFRDVRDVDLMMASANQHQHAVVIGGGLLGLEAANGLMVQGMDVTVVHRGDILMNVQMDQEAGGLLQTSLEKQGLKFAMDANTVALEGEERVKGVRLEDGRVLPADLVVMAVGIRPNARVGEKIGLQVEQGIVVDDQLKTSNDNIYALGECVQHRGQTYGLVAPLYEQADVLAQVLTGQKAAYVGSQTSTKLKVTGIQLFSAGDFDEGEDREVLLYRDKARQIYRKIVLQNDRVLGSVMFGDVQGANWIFEKLVSGEDISTVRDALLFGKGYC